MDLNNENQQEQKVEEVTRVLQPVSPPAPTAVPARRRRTERFAGVIDETEMRPPEEVSGTTPSATQRRPVFSLDDDVQRRSTHGQEADDAQNRPASSKDDSDAQRRPVFILDEPATAENGMTPAMKEAWEEPVHHDRAVPSQGVPQPGMNRPYRERRPKPVELPQDPQGMTTVRRPVQMEGYAPLQQLGTAQQSRARRPEIAPASSSAQYPRVRTPEGERSGYLPPQEEEDKRGGRGLIVVIIILLLIAAVILGLLMIPDDDPGVLGSIKHTVTEPIRGLLGGSTDKRATPPTASDLTAIVNKATPPYKVTFQMTTSANVMTIRVVDEHGTELPIQITLMEHSGEKSICWVFEAELEDSFSGSVRAQVQDGTQWFDTDQRVTLTLGTVAPAVFTERPTVPVATATWTAEPTVTASPTLTVSPTPTATATQAPAVMAPVVELYSPVPTSTSTATPTPAVTATPTLSVTATPTMVPTPEPYTVTVETATEAPTDMPAEETTGSPTETAAGLTADQPMLEAVADAKADPSLISETVIYKDGKKVSAYERVRPMNMPVADAYTIRAYGVTTFRGNAFRQNAAVDTVENPTGLSMAWQVEAGSVAGSSRTYYGIGWSSQPVIVRWPADVRKSMTLTDERKDQKHMTEVIVAGLDGRIYFLDLKDGSATRDAIRFGYPMRSTPSVHSLFYPMMTVGQYARKMKDGTSDSIGLYYYNLVDSKKLRMINGIDTKRTYSANASGAFDTSALIDRTTNTLIAIGTNGLLYTEQLSMQMTQHTGETVFEFQAPTESVVMMSHTKNQKAAYVGVESSLAMYGSYAFYADLGGILRCVDTTTMTTVWAVSTGDAVRAAIALDLEETEDGRTLWLYTANLVNNGRTRGDVTIRRYNAMTGAEDWAFAINCAEGSKKDVTFGNTVIPGAMASPVIGQQGLGDLVYFTLSSVSATGARTLSESAALPGVIIALDKASGKVVWHRAMNSYCYSSPVAVYDADGRGWIIQACADGSICLLDGLTGREISSLTVDGVIEGSPAVYGNMMVIGTTGKGKSYIYGIRID